MAAYVIFDVEIRDMARYKDFMKGVKAALDAAGARYLARGGATPTGRSTSQHPGRGTNHVVLRGHYC